MDRRSLLKVGFGSGVALALGPSFWNQAFAAVTAGSGPYGPLGTPGDYGVSLPAGFTSRLIGKTGELVAGTEFVWPGEPDGAATFATDDGGWIYTCNSELNGTRGGASSIRFDPSGKITDAYRILGGTKWNCSGGATPEGMWLSCEEFRNGQVWECDPTQPGQGIARPALGVFAHEAAVVDPLTGDVYLTEDDGNGRLYRFMPEHRGDLTAGTLQAAHVGGDSTVTWVEVSPKRPARGADTTAFDRGEGAWFFDRHLYFCTTGDNRVWDLDVAAGSISVLYDAATVTNGPLRDPDNITVHARSGDIYVAEDADDIQLVLIGTVGGERVAAPFLQFVGHGGSEVTGPAFSPDGTRLYVSSQRGVDGDGMTFEIIGPFRSA